MIFVLFLQAIFASINLSTFSPHLSPPTNILPILLYISKLYTFSWNLSWYFSDIQVSPSLSSNHISMLHMIFVGAGIPHLAMFWDKSWICIQKNTTGIAWDTKWDAGNQTWLVTFKESTLPIVVSLQPPVYYMILSFFPILCVIMSIDMSYLFLLNSNCLAISLKYVYAIWTYIKMII